MKILLTAFEPFGGSSLNPSLAAVSRVGAPYLILPVSAERAWDVLSSSLRGDEDYVICVGERRGGHGIDVERVAVNLQDFSIPDADGVLMRDEPVVEGGPVAYFSALPVRPLVEALRGAGIPSDLSLSAGSYLCNHVFYRLRYHGVPAGFLHVPSLPEQAVELGGGASMAVETTARALQIVLETLRLTR